MESRVGGTVEVLPEGHLAELVTGIAPGGEGGIGNKAEGMVDFISSCLYDLLPLVPERLLFFFDLLLDLLLF